MNLSGDGLVEEHFPLVLDLLQITLQKVTQAQVGNNVSKLKPATVELRCNGPLYNEVLGIRNIFFSLAKITVKYNVWNRTLI